MSSKNVGKIFETDFYNSCPDNAILIRLKDGKGYGKNPCDYVYLTSTRGAMLELKTTKEKRLPLSNIREHQLDILSEASRQGIGAYFVVNFRTYDETYIIDAQILQKEFSKGKKSISLNWFRENLKPIPQTKKRTRWRYNFNEVF